MQRLAEMTWEEVRDLDRSRTVAILPVGATEAHGPHLPLATDVIIAEAMARRGAERLEARGAACVLLPPIAYSVAGYAASFPGTVDLRPETATAVIVDVAASLGAHGISRLVVANAHLEPSHIGSLRRALEETGAGGRCRIAFPDVTRKPWALRLTEEFKSGACHAGRYEGSIVMAEAPELVREERRRALDPVAISLSQAIREGKRTFAEAGGALAYFGDPAAASAAEGRESIEVLGAILEDAVLEAFPELAGASGT